MIMPIGFHSNIILTFDFDNFLTHTFSQRTSTSQQNLLFILFIVCTALTSASLLSFILMLEIIHILRFIKYQTYLLYWINIPKIWQLVVIETDFMPQKGKVVWIQFLRNEIEDLQQFEMENIYTTDSIIIKQIILSKNIKVSTVFPW